MKDFRGPLPLTDADFTRIRANVMAEVRSSRRPSLLWRLAFAAAVAAFAFWRLFHVPAIEVIPPALPQVALTTTIPVPPLPAPVSVDSAPAGAEPAPIVAESAPPVVHVARHRKARRRPAIEAVRTVDTPEPVRIEIRTSDPDIRIIWLPNMEKKS